MKKLFYISILLAIPAIFMSSNSDLNQKVAYAALKSVIPCATPASLINKAWYTNDQYALYDISSNLILTSLKSYAAAVICAHLDDHPKIPHVSKINLFFKAHAVGMIPGILGAALVTMKAEAARLS